MALQLRTTYKPGDRVKFKQGVHGIAQHHLPSGIVGTVKSAYLEPYGLTLREHLDLEFQIPDASNSFAQPTTLELRAITSEQVERAN